MKILAMNRLSLPAVAVIVLMGTSCITDRLSGQTVKETRNVSTVNSLRLTMSADVYLTQGDNQSVVVEADKDVMQYIETEAEGETLVIKNREGHWRNSGQIKIYIT